MPQNGVVTGHTSQGYSAYIPVDQGESVVLHFDQGPMRWGENGFSWTFLPRVQDADIEVAVESSMLAEGDVDWTPDPESPYEEPYHDAESYRISRKRFTATEGNLHLTCLGSAGYRVEFE